MKLRFYVRSYDKTTKTGEWVPSQKTWPSVNAWAKEVGDFLVSSRTSFYLEDEGDLPEAGPVNPF